MATISARYGFKEPRSRAIERPDDPLYRAFGEWLKDVPEGKLDYLADQHESHYRNALDLVEKVDWIKNKTAQEIQIVLQSYQDDPKIINAGLFLSACYNTIEQRDLIWDLNIDTRVNWIGYRLGENKRLVLKTDSGYWIGTLSNGLLVNYAYIEGNMAFGAEGNAVNFGSVGWSMASRMKGNAVNFGSVGWWMADGAGNIQANIAIKSPDGGFHRNGEICLDEKQARQHPRLVKYFEDFKQQGEAYRNVGFPEYLGVFDVVEQFIGSGTGEELNKQFMQKLRGLL